jgi:diguanylate cyclase (GGDEF)-like protein
MVLETGSAALIGLAALAAGLLGYGLRGVRGRTQVSAPQPDLAPEPPTLQAEDLAAVAAANPAVIKRVDAVTGLPDRSTFDFALGTAVLRADREQQALCVLCVGVDNFQLLNDTYGHEAGDVVLHEAGQLVAKRAEGLAPVARLGGSEFLLVVQGEVEAGRRVAHGLLDAIARGIALDGQHLHVGCSIGIACYPKDGGRQLLVSHASMAMRAARQAGGGAHAEFDAQMGDDQREQAELARDLRWAIERKQLMLYYQPKVDAVSLQITAAEALLRWQHPTRGIVSPTVFIPIAERHGLIGAIGNWALEETTRQAGVWRDSGLRMRVAINVSGYQMRQDDFAERLENALRTHRLVPGRFTCEITETVAMEDTLVTQRAFARLGELGVHVSIDDFGTGHSSLALLRRLPAAELKIDRAFITDLGRSADALALVRAVVQMAHSLDLRVVAEGVETEAQRDQLRSLGCDEMQGFLFARPMSAAALELWAMDENEDDTERLGFRESLFKETLHVDL